MLICMLACYLTWHLRQAWAPLTYTAHQDPPAPGNHVSPAHRSAAARDSLGQGGQRRKLRSWRGEGRARGR